HGADEVGHRPRHPRGVRRAVEGVDAQPSGSQAGPTDVLGPNGEPPGKRGLDGPADGLFRRTGVDQCREEHVAGGPTDDVDEGDAAHAGGGGGPLVDPSRSEGPPPRPDRRAISAATYPAPTPSSMSTHTTPGVHELSMPRSAARPPKLAPYPTLVGHAMTGQVDSPPTTLAS